MVDVVIFYMVLVLCDFELVYVFDSFGYVGKGIVDCFICVVGWAVDDFDDFVGVGIVLFVFGYGGFFFDGDGFIGWWGEFIV